MKAAESEHCLAEILKTWFALYQNTCHWQQECQWLREGLLLRITRIKRRERVPWTRSGLSRLGARGTKAWERQHRSFVCSGVSREVCLQWRNLAGELILERQSSKTQKEGSRCEDTYLVRKWRYLQSLYLLWRVFFQGKWCHSANRIKCNLFLSTV